MKTPKVSEKLTKLPTAPSVFSKLRAALQKTGAFSSGSGQAENSSAYQATKECQAYQVEVERVKALAEVYARNVRRRLV